MTRHDSQRAPRTSAPSGIAGRAVLYDALVVPDGQPDTGLIIASAESAGTGERRELAERFNGLTAYLRSPAKVTISSPTAC